MRTSQVLNQVVEVSKPLTIHISDFELEVVLHLQEELHLIELREAQLRKSVEQGNVIGVFDGGVGSSQLTYSHGHLLGVLEVSVDPVVSRVGHLHGGGEAAPKASCDSGCGRGGGCSLKKSSNHLFKIKTGSMNEYQMKNRILKDFEELGIAPDYPMSSEVYFDCLKKLVCVLVGYKPPAY